MNDSILELIEESRGLVRSIALKVYRNIPVRVDLEDLIAYGDLGLAEAARDFDPEKGNQFATFAYYRIRGAIYDGLAKMTWTSRARYRRMRYESMANQVLENDGQSQEPLSAEQSGEWFARTTEKLAMVYLVSDRASDTDPLDDAVDRSEDDVQRFIHREVTDKLKQLVLKLPSTESRLIQLVYFEGFTLQEAGQQLGFSKSWASRLHARILDELAGEMKRMNLHD